MKLWYQSLTRESAWPDYNKALAETGNLGGENAYAEMEGMMILFEKLSKQQGFGRIVDVTIQSVMTEYPIRLRGAMVARQIPVKVSPEG